MQRYCEILYIIYACSFNYPALLSPTYPQKKDDTVLLPRFINWVQKNQWWWVGDGRYLTSHVHVDNCCEGCVLVAERGKAGECYFLTDGPPNTFRKFVSDMLKAKGCKLPTSWAPRPVAKLWANVAEGWCRRFSKKPYSGIDTGICIFRALREITPLSSFKVR